jgi:hypothetical protein
MIPTYKVKQCDAKTSNFVVRYFVWIMHIYECVLVILSYYLFFVLVCAHIFRIVYQLNYRLLNLLSFDKDGLTFIGWFVSLNKMYEFV